MEQRIKIVQVSITINITQYIAHWVTRGILPIMLFVRPTRGHGERYWVNNSLKTRESADRRDAGDVKFL